MDPKLLEVLNHYAGFDTWQERCVNELLVVANETGPKGITAGIVKFGGVPLTDGPWQSKDIWGISYDLCLQHCSINNFPMVFNYQNFVGRLTNYLLPWFALTAQLPYEAGTVGSNVMSFFMALGSPMLITFSLMMTIFNRRFLDSKSVKLKPGGPEHLPATSRNARIFLEAAQQVPLRLKGRDGWLASLVFLPGRNKIWWDQLGERVLATRRGVTLSLVAQMLVAVSAWTLTIIGSFGNSLGSHAEALVLSSSTLWTWLVPVICGWITVGTQSKLDGLALALTTDEIELDDYFRQQQVGAVTKGGDDSTQAFDIAECPSPFNVYGDEVQPGPAFNYARIFTWRHNAVRLLDYFQQVASTSPSMTVPSRYTDDPVALDIYDLKRKHVPPESQIAPQPTHLTTSTRLDELTEYPRPSELPGEFWLEVVASIVMAVFVQWGSAGAAIVIAYLTDIKGLGCRSGSYLLYGTLSTAAFLCFFCSTLLTWAARLRAQAQAHPQHHSRSSAVRNNRAYKLLWYSAATLRVLGRILCISAGLWIILSSIFELIGFFDNCWCEGTMVGPREKPWVLLFKTQTDLRETATPSWAGGVTLSFCVAGISYLVFWLYCQRNDE